MKRLRDFTLARIGLERAGNSLATREVLAFQLAHAQARDAVGATLDVSGLARECEALGWETLRLASAAPDHATYLRRPDLGRRLDEASRAQLHAAAQRLDLAVLVTGGLSALAVQRHAPALLAELTPLLDKPAWTRSPLVLVERGRVALGDEIGERLNASLTLVLIGERPGLSSPDSLGAYLTWDPHPGRTDAERNCISNIRPEGLVCPAAARRIFALLTSARQRRLSGVALKEDFPLIAGA
jgi:ethanolamine ammonia-lyase small subunit